MDRDSTQRDEEVGKLELRFDRAMMEIYERAGHEEKYWATRYLQMLRRIGGLATARRLLKSAITSDGYAKLRDANRLDLTVEALVQQPEWASLFSAEEVQRARDRYAHYEAMPTPSELEPSTELTALVARANAAPASSRIKYRDDIASHGPGAIAAVRRSLNDTRICRKHFKSFGTHWTNWTSVLRIGSTRARPTKCRRN